MSKLIEKTTSDYEKFEQKMTEKGAEEAFKNAWKIVIAGEWLNYFENQFRKYLPEELDILLESSNIIENLADFTLDFEDITFSPQEFCEYLTEYLEVKLDLEER